MEAIITFTARVTNFPPFKNLTWDLKPGVNFLVGPNGVGKTRLIDSIKKGRLKLNAPKISIIMNKGKRQNITTMQSDSPYQYLDWGKFKYDDLQEANQDYANINSNFKLCGQPILDEEEIEKSNTPMRNERGRIVKTINIESEFKLHGVDFETDDMLSQGTKFLYETLNWNIPLNKGNHLSRFNSKPPLNYFIFLEEPENSLHPDIQKKIPSKLVEWYKKQNKRISDNLFVIVTTHSPFILKGMDMKDKSILSCFVMKRDSISLESLNHDQVITEGNHLLGVGIGDLLPGQVILAENSIVKLIETITQNLSINVPAFFVTSGGDGDTDNRIKNIQALQKMLKSMSKTYPERFLLNMSYVVIFDDEAKKKEGEQGLIDNPVEGFDVVFENLGKLCLEDSYPLAWINEYRRANYNDKSDWNGAGSYTTFCKDVLLLTGRDIGKHKNALAEFVGAKITSWQLLRKHLPELNTIMRAYL